MTQPSWGLGSPSPAPSWQTIGGTNSASAGAGPGMFGTGQYTSQGYSIDPTAFQNPIGNVAPQLGSAISGLPGSTPQVTAATSPYTAAGAGGQLGAAGTLNAIGTGAIPSAAAIQAGQQGAGNLAGAESMLGAARGAGGPAAAQIAAQRALAEGQQQTAQNAILGAAQEQVGALGTAGGLYGGAAGTGLGQTGQQNTVGVANQQAQQQAQLAQLQALQQQNQQQQQGAQQGQQLGVQQQLGLGQIGSQSYQNAAQNNAKATGSLFSGLGGLIGGLFS